jgi:hypothetical protein
VTATGARTLPIALIADEWCGARRKHDSQGDTHRATPTVVVCECICGGGVNGFAIFRSSVFDENIGVLCLTATGAYTLSIALIADEWCGARSKHDSQGDTHRATPTVVVCECICGGGVNGFALFRSSVFDVNICVL